MGSSSGSSATSDVFDVRKVRKLVELMDDHELAEIDLRQGDQRIRLRRDVEPPATLTMSAASQLGAAPAQPATAAAVPAASPPVPPVAEDEGVTINSPMVGTFYTAATPEAASFVKVGDQVGPDTTVCIVEAMKVFNEIPAECSGKILAILVENGAAVEFAQPLFKVQPT